MLKSEYTQWVFSCSKSTMKTIEQGVSEVKKRHLNNLIDLKKLTNNNVALVSLYNVNIEKILHLFTVFILEFQKLLLAEFISRDQSTDK